MVMSAATSPRTGGDAGSTAPDPAAPGAVVGPERPALGQPVNRRIRSAIAYDCLYPYTVGGAERWYRTLAEIMSSQGIEVTYLTRQQWDQAEAPEGLQVQVVSGPSSLYDHRGSRRLWPTIKFGLGLGRWLLRHRSDYDVVHVSSFPFWSVLAARLALIGSPTSVVVDWLEIWSWSFWRSYAGTAAGTVGFCIQHLCMRLSTQAVTYANQNAARLAQVTGRPPSIVGGLMPPAPSSAESSSGSLAGAASAMVSDMRPTEAAERSESGFVLYAGRHIQDKGTDLLPEILLAARQVVPGLKMVVTGDGPLRVVLEEKVNSLGLADHVDIRGFVNESELACLMKTAACVVLPSRREGYGMAVVEACSHGTPVVTAAFPENLATDNVVDGLNGWIADPATDAIGRRVGQVVLAGEPLRRGALSWYQERATSAGMDVTARAVAELHTRLAARFS
jgi:glycosyltransferase involved in cell wall biosynthesis